MNAVQNPNLPRQSFLDTHRQDELDELFASLGASVPGNIKGLYQGRLIGISGLSCMPKLVKWFLYGLLGTWLNPWRGKQFNSDGGANQWGIGSMTFGWGEYRVETKNEDAMVKLDYDVPVNPRLLRPILGEIRPLTNGMWLARMRYRTRNRVKTLAYFTLRERR